MANSESHWRLRISFYYKQGVWMRILRGRDSAAVGAAIVVVFVVSGSSWARTVRTRVHAGIRSSMRVKSHPVVMRGEEVVPGVMPEEVSSSGEADAMPVDAV